MSSAASTCPYCNTPLDNLAAGATLCPRCGEKLPTSVVAALSAPPAAGAGQAIRAGEPSTGPAAAAAGTQTAADPAGFPPKPVAANRKTALLVLGLMFTMAGIALVYALSTQGFRRSLDPKKVEASAPLVTQTPGELSGLGWLPRNVNVAAGIHVADFLKDKDGEAAKLLAEPRPELLNWALGLATTHTGLSVNEIDHVVLGTTLGPTVPTITLVVETKKPYSLDAVEKAMPVKPTSRDGAPLYRFKVKPTGEAYAWCRAKQTLIFLIHFVALDKTKDLESIPAKPAVGDDAIPPALRPFITKRLEKQSLLWIAGDLSPLEQIAPLLGLLGGKEVQARLELWTKVREFGLSVGLHAPGELELRGQFQTATPAAAKTLEAALRALKLPREFSSTVEAPREGAVDPADLWVLWQVRTDAASLRERLNVWSK